MQEKDLHIAAVAVVIPIKVFSPFASLLPLHSIAWSSDPVVVINYGLVLW